MDLIKATYQLRCSPDQAPALAEAIAWEQTVECPPALVPDSNHRASHVGQILKLSEPTGSNAPLEVDIGYPAHLVSGQLQQLMNLIYGNVSMYPGVRLTALHLPPSLLEQFPGPAFGCEGIRELTGVFGRPLLATAIKPRGLPVAELAEMAGAFAANGGDVIKDDQNLVDADFEQFQRRVSACRDAVWRANDRSGRQCLYLPYLCAPTAQLDRYLDLIEGLELPGVLVAPMIAGLDLMRMLSNERGLITMAHPALTGSITNPADNGIDHALLMGTLFRLAGADISVFPGFGGRISYPHAVCQQISRALTEPLGSLRPAFPSPAGGKSLNQVAELVADAGEQSLLLVGGSLLSHPKGVAGGTRAFLAAIREQADEQRRTPKPWVPQRARAKSAFFKVDDDYQWQGVTSQVYKLDADADFARARRVELVRGDGARCQFDVRYFELQAGGYTSLEKHQHVHVVIGARGQGVLHCDGQDQTLAMHDVATIAPLQTHQLRNPGDQPFGFFCLVDHLRDPPQPA